ncbi:MAG: OmpA family protein, partial [Myxococcota bacterium]|nr:OmpA family protein [Myxococcota bacterium]
EGKSGKENEPPLLGYRSMPLVELVERLTQLNLRNVSVEHRPQLAEQGKQACAERGERIAVASPEVLDDARVMAHEAAHIVQQRGGAKLEVEGASEAQAPQGVGAEHGKAELTGDAGGSAPPTAPVASASEASRGEGAQPAVPEQKLGEQAKRPIDKKSTDYEAEADAAAVSFMGGPVPEGGLQLSAASQAVMYGGEPEGELEAEPSAPSLGSEPQAAMVEVEQEPAPAYVDRADWPTLKALFVEKPGSVEAVRGFVAGCSMLEPQLPIWQDGIVLVMVTEKEAYGSIRWPTATYAWVLAEQRAFLAELRGAKKGAMETAASGESNERADRAKPETGRKPLGNKGAAQQTFEAMSPEETAAWRDHLSALELPAELRKVVLRVDPTLVSLDRLDQLFEILRHELTHAMQLLATNGDFFDLQFNPLELGAYYESARVSAEYELEHVDRSHAMQTLGTLAGHWTASPEEYKSGQSQQGRSRVDEFVETQDFFLRRMAELFPVEFAELRCFIFGPEVEEVPEPTPESILTPRGTSTVGDLALQVKGTVQQMDRDRGTFSLNYLVRLERGELPPAAEASWERERDAMGWEQLVVELQRLTETMDRAGNGGRTSGELVHEETKAANAQWENPSPLESSVFWFEDIGQTQVDDQDYARLRLWCENAKALKLETLARIEVRGYSDDQGEPAVQRSISQQRADAVKRALVESGIPAEKIEAVGLGFVEPKHGRAAVSQLEKRKQELAACDSEDVKELAACESEEVKELTGLLESARVQFRVVELVATQGGAP